jgi:hypothetical protein
LPILLLALLASCSAVRVSYDNADWVLTRMAGSYVDMDRRQAQALKVRLGELHAWHRSAELPQYAEMLETAAARLERGMSQDDVVWAVGAVRARYKVLGREAAENLAPLLMTLTDGQVDRLEQRFADDNRKFYAAKLPKDPEEAVRARADWICDRLDDWTGDLTPAQRQRVEDLARAFPQIPALRLEDRKRRQVQLLTTLRARAEDPQTQAQLVTLLADPDAGRSERYRLTLVAWEARFIDVMVELERGLTPRQRAMAVERLRRYAEEFRSMAGQRVAFAGAGGEQAVERPASRRASGFIGGAPAQQLLD